jgi:hypothetical protein
MYILTIILGEFIDPVFAKQAQNWVYKFGHCFVHYSMYVYFREVFWKAAFSIQQIIHLKVIHAYKCRPPRLALGDGLST